MNSLCCEYHSRYYCPISVAIFIQIARGVIVLMDAIGIRRV